MKKVTKIILILIVVVLFAHVCLAQYTITFDMRGYMSRSKKEKPKEEPPEVKPDAGVNTRDGDGYTALMRAAWEGHTETVKVLLEAGADVNAKGNDGWTALMWAEYMGHTSIIEILKKSGAKE